MEEKNKGTVPAPKGPQALLLKAGMKWGKTATPAPAPSPPAPISECPSPMPVMATRAPEPVVVCDTPLPAPEHPLPAKLHLLARRRAGHSLHLNLNLIPPLEPKSYISMRNTMVSDSKVEKSLPVWQIIFLVAVGLLGLLSYPLGSPFMTVTVGIFIFSVFSCLYPFLQINPPCVGCPRCKPRIRKRLPSGACPFVWPR